MKRFKTPLWLTKDEDAIAKTILHNIKCLVDKKTNVITITVTDQDPLVAALMADSVKSHLQVAITDYRTKKHVWIWIICKNFLMMRADNMTRLVKFMRLMQTLIKMFCSSLIR